MSEQLYTLDIRNTVTIPVLSGRYFGTNILQCVRCFTLSYIPHIFSMHGLPHSLPLQTWPKLAPSLKTEREEEEETVTRRALIGTQKLKSALRSLGYVLDILLVDPGCDAAPAFTTTRGSLTRKPCTLAPLMTPKPSHSGLVSIGADPALEDVSLT